MMDALKKMKQKARILAKAVSNHVGQALSLSSAYAILAKMEGAPNWNDLSAKLSRQDKAFRTQAITSVRVLELFMPDILGDYETPDSRVEWQWVEKMHSFVHKGNGIEGGVYEYMVHVARITNSGEPLPEWMEQYYQLAVESDCNWIMFYQ